MTIIDTIKKCPKTVYTITQNIQIETSEVLTLSNFDIFFQAIAFQNDLAL